MNRSPRTGYTTSSSGCLALSINCRENAKKRTYIDFFLSFDHEEKLTKQVNTKMGARETRKTSPTSSGVIPTYWKQAFLHFQSLYVCESTRLVLCKLPEHGLHRPVAAVHQEEVHEREPDQGLLQIRKAKTNSNSPVCKITFLTFMTPIKPNLSFPSWSLTSSAA